MKLLGYIFRFLGDFFGAIFFALAIGCVTLTRFGERLIAKKQKTQEKEVGG